MVAVPAAPTAPAMEPATEDVALRRISRLRELPAARTVPRSFVPRAALLELVRKHIGREIPRSAIEVEGRVQKLLGLFPTGADYEKVTYALLLDHLAGFYEPADGRMYLANDLDEAETDATLSHELVHALQDQHWKPAARPPEPDPRDADDDDRQAAIAALAEGEATSVMIDATSPATSGGALALDDDALQERVLGGMDSGSNEGASDALRRAIAAPYVDGVRFVNTLRRRGGWALVNRAWSSPPATTEQILHSEKWLAHEPALKLAVPGPPSAGYSLVQAATYGEQGLLLTFRAWMTEAAARQAASAWGGDRLGLYERAGHVAALAWHVRYDTSSRSRPEAFAIRAFSLIADALPDVGRVVSRTASVVCVERPGNGVVSVLRRGRDLYFVFGAVATDSRPWRPVMRCAAARAWNDELGRADANAARMTSKTGAPNEVEPGIGGRELDLVAFADEVLLDHLGTRGARNRDEDRAHRLGGATSAWPRDPRER
jgi:hypothetical protein